MDACGVEGCTQEVSKKGFKLMEADARYTARKRAKQGLYAKHGLNLIELGDEHLLNLDDYLPRFLLKHGIQTL